MNRILNRIRPLALAIGLAGLFLVASKVSSCRTLEYALQSNAICPADANDVLRPPSSVLPEVYKKYEQYPEDVTHAGIIEHAEMLSIERTSGPDHHAGDHPIRLVHTKDGHNYVVSDSLVSFNGVQVSPDRKRVCFITVTGSESAPLYHGMVYDIHTMAVMSITKLVGHLFGPESYLNVCKWVTDSTILLSCDPVYSARRFVIVDTHGAIKFSAMDASSYYVVEGIGVYFSKSINVYRWSDKHCVEPWIVREREPRLLTYIDSISMVLAYDGSEVFLIDVNSPRFVRAAVFSTLEITDIVLYHDLLGSQPNVYVDSNGLIHIQVQSSADVTAYNSKYVVLETAMKY